jgi:ankyrin repeat protein
LFGVIYQKHNTLIRWWYDPCKNYPQAFDNKQWITLVYGGQKMVCQKIIIFSISIMIALPVWAGNINSELIAAAGKGDITTVEDLIAKGANVNARNAEDWTALMLAGKGGHTGVVKAVLEKGAKVNMKNIYGFTALMWAAKGGHTDTVKTMLDKGADVNIKNMGGLTALIYAASEGHTDTVEVLKARSGNSNRKTKDKIAFLKKTAKPHSHKVGLSKRAGVRK